MDLRGASAEALAALTERLDDALGTQKAAATLGDELFTVSQLVRRGAAGRGQAGHGPAGVLRAGR